MIRLAIEVSEKENVVRSHCNADIATEYDVLKAIFLLDSIKSKLYNKLDRGYDEFETDVK